MDARTSVDTHRQLDARGASRLGATSELRWADATLKAGAALRHKAQLDAPLLHRAERAVRCEVLSGYVAGEKWMGVTRWRVVRIAGEAVGLTNEANLAGGGANARTLELPSYDQNKWHYGEFSNHLNNCGAVCCTDIHEYFSGEFINPDKIHDELKGDRPHNDPLLYTSQLSRWLINRGHPAEDHTSQSRSEYASAVKAALDEGRPLIVLQRFNRKRLRNDGHFIVVRGYDDSSVYLCNPWGPDRDRGHKGLYETMDWFTFHKLAHPQRWYISIRQAKRIPSGDGPLLRWRSATLKGGAAIRLRGKLDAKLVHRAPNDRECEVQAPGYVEGDAWGGTTRWRVVRLGDAVFGLTNQANINNERSS